MPNSHQQNHRQSQRREFWRQCAVLRDPLVGVARRYVAPSDAEDVVHDALIRAAEYERIDLHRLRPFLHAVIRRLSIDRARRRAVAARAASHPVLQPLTSADPAERVCEAGEAAWLVGRLGQLPPAERTLVHLAARGCTPADAAHLAGLSHHGVRRTMLRIRRRVTSWRLSM